MKISYAQEMFLRFCGASFIIILAILFLASCNYEDTMVNEQELQGKELTKASCEELYKSMEKCDTTGIRFSGAREQCKTNHIILLNSKCLEED